MKVIQVQQCELLDGYNGACIVCGTKVDGVEPDASDYKCPNCGNFAVYGLESLLIMGMLHIKD